MSYNKINTKKNSIGFDPTDDTWDESTGPQAQTQHLGGNYVTYEIGC